MGKLDDWLNDMDKNSKDFNYVEGDSENGPAGYAAIHNDFKSCDKIYYCTLGNPKDQNLLLIIGQTSDEKYILVGFGENDPFVLAEEEFYYLIVAFTSVGNKLFNGDLQKNIDEGLKTGSCVPTIGSGRHPNGSPLNVPESEFEGKTPVESLEKIKDLMNKKKKAEEAMKDFDEDDIDTPEYNEALKMAEDFSQTLDSFSEEEKKQLAKELSKQNEENIYKKAKALEKDLLGDIEEDEAITYDYRYFKKVFKEQGPEHLREELAKIPKEERPEVIQKIVTEVKAEDAEGGGSEI